MSDMPLRIPAFVTANYYYLSNKIIFGPVTAQKIQELYQAEALLPTDPIWVDSIEGNGTPLQQTELGIFLHKKMPLPKADIQFENVTEGMLQPLQDRPKFLPQAELAAGKAPRTGNYIYSDVTFTAGIFFTLLLVQIGLGIGVSVVEGMIQRSIAAANATAQTIPVTDPMPDPDNVFEDFRPPPPSQPPPPASLQSIQRKTLEQINRGLIWSALLLSLFCVLTYYAWLHQAVQNVHALGAQGLSFSPAWAVGCHFVPILNLWKPFQALNQLCQASADVRDWQSRGLSPLVVCLWLLCIPQFVFLFRASQELNQAMLTANQALPASFSNNLQYAIYAGIVTLCLIVALVILVTSRQRKQYANKHAA